MARFKKARRSYARVKKRYNRHKSTGGIMGDVMAGGLVGIGATFLSPYINQYVPSVAGVSSTAIALTGGGIAAKALLHKGGKYADAMIIVGVAMAASNLASGVAGGSGSGEAVY